MTHISLVPPVNKIRRQWKLLLILQRRLEQTAEKILKAVKNIYIYIETLIQRGKAVV